jgi:acetone carboxylase gamma subunit
MAKAFTSAGIFGGYPASTAYVHNLGQSDLIERAARGESYPTGDGSYDDPALFELEGTRTYKQDALRTLEPARQGDLFLMTYKGGGGVGDPLLRPVESVEADVADGHLLPEYAEKVYAVSDRPARLAQRLDRAVPASEWWQAQRERVLAADLIAPVVGMLAESMRLSPRFAAEYRGFWDLPEDFEFDVVTPTVAAAASEPGKVSPAESVARYLDGSDVFTAEQDRSDVTSGTPVTTDVLGDMLDGRLSRRAVKEIQSGFKDAGRFDQWIAVLQARVGWGDAIVLPLGEGLNVVKRAADGEYVIRTDAGADLCRWHENWKMHSVVLIRDTEEAMREVYPQMGHSDPEWMELREFHCPVSGALLEVEAVPPGYPVVHDFLPDIPGFYSGWLNRELP